MVQVEAVAVVEEEVEVEVIHKAETFREITTEGADVTIGIEEPEIECKTELPSAIVTVMNFVTL